MRQATVEQLSKLVHEGSYQTALPILHGYRLFHWSGTEVDILTQEPDKAEVLVRKPGKAVTRHRVRESMARCFCRGVSAGL